MKKINDIYATVISKENLYRSDRLAARGRRYRDTVADFNFFLEQEIQELHRDLAQKSYRHGKYRMFTIHDPKERNIAAAPFRDRVVHHAVHDIIEPFIDKTFIYDSYACRNDKGTHKAIDRAQAFLRRNAFCFHGDIKKYFQSIDHAILKQMIAQRIGDRDLLWLINEIIDSAPSLKRNGMVSGVAKGLPIGNLTSQFFANLYLNELDYFIKFTLRLRYYIRYMDDFLIFGNDKESLLKIKSQIHDFLRDELKVEMHEGKSQVYRTSRGIKFLGFRIFKAHRRLTSDNIRRFKKRLKKFAYLLGDKKMDTEKITDSVRCWVSHSKYGQTNGLRLNIYNKLLKNNYSFAGLLKDILLDKDLSERERERERERRKNTALTLMLNGFKCRAGMFKTPYLGVKTINM